MKRFYFFIVLVFAVVQIWAGGTAEPIATETLDQMYVLGQYAAMLAMEQLEFEYGDSDVVALTDAGRAVVDGRTTERALSGITSIAGLRNGDNTLYQINRADWKALWFYFYDKNTGKGLYLIPDEGYYTMGNTALETFRKEDAFSTASLVTGDINQMLADTDIGDATVKALGENAFSLLTLSNTWAHGAPYDLMSVAALHNHFCPGVSSGYILVKYIEEKLPLENGDSYIVISNPKWCKEDNYPILWDMTPGKGGVASSAVFTDEDGKYLTEKYGVRPAGIFVRWNSESNSGAGLALGFQFDTSGWNGPAWGQKVVMAVDMVENLDNPEDYVVVMKEFSVDEEMLSQLQKPLNNPYKVAGMME